ncbi:hypothetical protein SMICM304S_08074 [Streptomyces microflavus]
MTMYAPPYALRRTREMRGTVALQVRVEQAWRPAGMKSLCSWSTPGSPAAVDQRDQGDVQRVAELHTHPLGLMSSTPAEEMG